MYHQRPGRRRDGCATFWRASRLQLQPGPPLPPAFCSQSTHKPGGRGLARASSSGNPKPPIAPSSLPSPSLTGTSPPAAGFGISDHMTSSTGSIGSTGGAGGSSPGGSAQGFDGVYRLGFSEMALDDNVGLIVRLVPRTDGTGGTAVPDGDSDGIRPEQGAVASGDAAGQRQSTPGGSSEIASAGGSGMHGGAAAGGNGSSGNGSGCSGSGGPPVLLVSNTHICFDPNKGDVKLGQVRTLLNKVRACCAQLQ